MIRLTVEETNLLSIRYFTMKRATLIESFADTGQRK